MTQEEKTAEWTPKLLEAQGRDIVADGWFVAKAARSGVALEMVRRWNANPELVAALHMVRQHIGWRGSGPNDVNDFYCEHCKATHVDWSKIPHTDDCLVKVVDAALSASKED